jgi:hypothetical protein
MMRIAFLILSLLSSAALAQSGSTIKQSGTVTPGHAMMWVTNGVAGDGGTATQGNLTSIGVTASGNGICQNSGPVTGPYNRICLGATQTGGGTLSVNNFGGATGGLTFLVNGAAQTIPTVTTPTTTGNPACFTNSTGTMANCVVTGTGNVVLASGPTISNLILNITGSTQCLQANSSGLVSGVGSPCGSGGGGAVSSVSNSDGTLTIAPTTGTVVASLNQASNFTLSGIVNLTGTVQVSGKAMTFPGAPATLAYINGSIVSGDCAQFTGTVGAISDAGAPCGSGGGGGGSTANRQEFVGDGSTTGFTLSSAPINSNAVIVNQNGVTQVGLGANKSWTLSGSTITFVNAPVSGTLIEVNWYSVAISAGTVTTVSVVPANGFAGTVATATSTPAITLTTTITGLLKGNGTAISAATAGTDYLTPTGNGSGLSGIPVSIADSGAGTIVVSASTGAVTLRCVTGTTSQLGCLKPDGSTIGVTAGVISVIGGSSVTWPTTGDLVVSNSTNSPAGLAPVNGDCVLGAGGVWTAGACAGGAAVASVGNASADTSLTIGGTGSGPWTGSVTAKINLANAQTWSALQTFADGDLGLGGSSSGTLVLHAPAVASTYSYTFPAPTTGTTDTVVLAAATQTLTNKSISAAQINSGTISVSRLPLASSSALGIVQGDGVTVSINGSGVITNVNLKVVGSSSGTTSFGSANASATSYTITLPAVNDTVGTIGTPDQVLSGGVILTSYGYTTGSITVDCGKNPSQYVSNNGAFTITAPTNDNQCVMLIRNTASAGAITFSGFTSESNHGDSLTTTSGSAFMISFLRITDATGAKATYLVHALQ